jgi:hypothetical protein
MIMGDSMEPAKDNLFINWRKKLEQGAGFHKGDKKGPESLDDKLKAFEYYHNPETNFQSDLEDYMEKVVLGGEEGNLKGAKYHAYSAIDKFFGKDAKKKATSNEDIRKMLEPTMDYLLTHLLSKGFEKMKANAKEYGMSDEEFFMHKAKELDMVFNGGGQTGQGGKRMSFAALVNALKGKNKSEARRILAKTLGDVREGYIDHFEQQMTDGYFTQYDKFDLHDKYLAKLKEQNKKPKKNMLVLDHYGILGAYAENIKEMKTAYKPIEKKK